MNIVTFTHIQIRFQNLFPSRHELPFMECRSLTPLLLLLLLCSGILVPAFAIDSQEIKAKEEAPGPVYIVPDLLQVQSKATWGSQDWKNYGDKLVHDANMQDLVNDPGSSGFGAGALSIVGSSDPTGMRLNALKAYEQGLKSTDPTKPDTTAADLWNSKALVYQKLDANNRALEALDKSLQSSPSKDINYVGKLENKAAIQKSLGMTAEAKRTEEEAKTLEDKISRQSGGRPMPLSLAVIVMGVLGAVTLITLRRRRSSPE